MSERTVVITGIGVLSSAGIGKEAFWQGLLRGKEAISEISLFDTSDLRCHKAGEIVAFEPEPFLGRRGLKYLDRSTQLAGAATSLALADVGIASESASELEIGLVLGTAFGSLDSISRFDQEAYREGPRYVRPMDFPKTVINSPAGHTAIKFGLSGLNATISTGLVSSLHAIKYATDCIAIKQADIVLAGGVEELCMASYMGFDKLHLLAGTRPGTPEKAAPFDRRRHGIVLGEGAALLVLESL